MKSHAIAANPDMITGLNLSSDTINVVKIAPGAIELQGANCFNAREYSMNVVTNMGTREVLDKSLLVYIYAYNDDFTTKIASFQASHTPPDKDRFGNAITGPNYQTGAYLTLSDKLYSLIGIVQYEDVNSENINVIFDTLKQDVDVNIVIEQTTPSSKTQAGIIKIAADPLDFTNATDALTPSMLQPILAQSTIAEFTFIGDGTLNSFQLDKPYESKELLIIAGGAFMAPNKYTVDVDGKLSFIEIIPDDVEISVRPMFTSINAFSPYKTAEIAGRLSMYILNNADSL